MRGTTGAVSRAFVLSLAVAGAVAACSAPGPVEPAGPRLSNGMIGAGRGEQPGQDSVLTPAASPQRAAPGAGTGAR
jgi:hypothetical protein